MRQRRRIDFHVAEGETHALIGPNGAGKTLHQPARGKLRPDAAASASRRGHHALSRRSARARFGALVQITASIPASRRSKCRARVQARSGHSFRFWRDARSDPRSPPARQVLEEVGLEERINVLAAISRTASSASFEVAMRSPRGPLLLLDEPWRHGHRRVEHMIGLLASLSAARPSSWSSTTWTRCSASPTGFQCWLRRVIASGSPEKIKMIRSAKSLLGEDA